MSRYFYLPLMILAISGCGGGLNDQSDSVKSDGNEVASGDLDNDGVLDSNDCAPEDNSRWKLIAYQYQDKDFDGKYSPSQGEICSAEILPTGYSSDKIPLDQLDCNDQDSSTYLTVTYMATDLDLDGYQAVQAGKLCTDGTIPAGYQVEINQNLSPDCNDDDLSKWRIVVIYKDVDGDGVGSGKGTATCIGKFAPSGYSILGYDPLDNLTNPDSPNITDFDIPFSTIMVMESDADPDF